MVYDNGICAVFDSKAGTQIYKARIGSGATFSSSPWAADGRIFCLSEDGDAFVILAGDEYKQVGRNGTASGRCVWPRRPLPTAASSSAP